MAIDVPRAIDHLMLEVEPEVGGRAWGPCPFHGLDDEQWILRWRQGREKATWFVRTRGARRGQTHCLGAETRVLTRDGERRIADLVGRRVEVLTVDGPVSRWVWTTFESYGRQELLTIVVSRNGVKRTIRATDEHRWFVKDASGLPKSGWRECFTKDLAKGDRLRPARLPRSPTVKPSPWGIAHGIVFGDGTIGWGGNALVTLWGEKDRALLRFFPLSKTRPAITPNGVKGLTVSGLPRAFKRLPEIDDAASYLFGWLAGYFAADGCVSESGMPMLACAKREILEFVERVCLRLGIFSHGIREQVRIGLGKEPSSIFQLSFSRSTLNEEFFLVDEHRRRWLAGREVIERIGWAVDEVIRTGEIEEVFCTEVPETHCFALAGHILTGNCFACKRGGSLIDLVMHVIGISYGSAKEWLKEHEREDVVEPLPTSVRLSLIGIAPEGLLVPRGVVWGEPLAEWFAPARRYVHKRGITEEQVRAWGMGYATEGRLAGRIVIPIHDDEDEIVSYAARTYLNDPDAVRYLCPSAADKPDVERMFGERRWPTFADRDLLVVVEGAIDGLAVERAGFPHFAALAGSHVRPMQVARISSWREVVILTDPDDAGDGAASELHASLVRHREVHRVRLPPKMDAAKMIREELRACIEGRGRS